MRNVCTYSSGAYPVAAVKGAQSGARAFVNFLQSSDARASFERAGFRDVIVEKMEAPVRLPTAAECVRFERESFGALHQMMATLSETERADTWREIEHELRRFEGSDGFVGPCEMLVGAAVK